MTQLYFNGKIDELKLYNRVITTYEITANYEAQTISSLGSNDPKKNQVADWRFDGDSKDSSAYSLLTTDNGATLTVGRFGNANKAYLFDGTNDWMQINHDFWNNNPDGLAVSMWTKDNAAGVISAFRMYHNGGNQADKIIGLHFPFNDGNIYYDVGVFGRCFGR
jgi:hypothetical protein